MTDWIETYTGKKFRFLNPRPEDVDVRDIAHALALTCRFKGHCTEYYSVAEHSIRMSHLVPDRLALEALLHDAAEAYLCDLPRPVKREMPAYEVAECRVNAAIRKVIGLPGNMPDEIHHWDDVMLKTEARDLGFAWWSDMTHVLPLDEKIVPWDWRKAKHAFLYRYEELVG
jgi:hypothetical protein